MMQRISLTVLLALLGLAEPSGAAATGLPQPVLLTLRTGPQAAQPGVALERGRGFVVTWQESTGVDASLHYATIDFEGRETGRGRIASGRDWFVNWADTPALVVLDNGDWVAFWLQRHGDETPGAYDVRLVRSTNRGQSWSESMSPHRDGTATQHGFVSLVADGADRVLIVWLDGRLAAKVSSSEAHDHEAAPMTLRAAVIDRAGRLSGESELDARTCSCCQTDAARWVGRTLVAYRDRSDEEIRDIAVVARGVDGRWSAPRTLHDDRWRIEGCPVNGPAVAVNGSTLLVFWPTLVGESMQLRYSLREWDRPGATRTLETAAPASGRVDAAPWGDDRFLVTWVSRAPDRPGIEYALIDASGRAELGAPIAHPGTRGRAAGFPRLASDGNRALFAWTESNAAGAAGVLGMALLRRGAASALSPRDAARTGSGSPAPR